MQLVFEGDIGLATALVVGIVAGLLVWMLYRGDVIGRAGRWAWAPAAMRVAAVVMIVFMLTGPVLRGTVRLSDRSQVLVVVDESQSMDLSDETMSAARKLWLAHQRGWLAASEFDASPLQAAIHLDNFVSLTGELAPDITAGEAAGQTASSQNQIAANAIDELKLAMQAASDAAMRQELERDLLAPSQLLTDSSSKTSLANKSSWSELAAVAQGLSSKLRKAAADQAEQKVAENNAAVERAIDRFHKRTRWQRLENLLLNADNACLPALAIDHDLQLHSITGLSGKSRLIWKEGEVQETPNSLGTKAPQGASTDLAESVAEIVGEQPLGGSLAVVLLTDGQHNHSAENSRTPTHIAKLLAKRGAPLYTVGFGALNPPRDLAILGVHAPESVFADDRVKGRILLKDNMPPGKPLAMKIELEGEELWERRLRTNGANARTIDFDFSIEQHVKDRLARTPNATDAISLPLPLKVRIVPVEGELRDDNNEYDAHVRAITRPRRILMIDGRPRWEQRYIRNLFRRDQQWEVNDVLVEWSDDDDDFSLPRGVRPHQFPPDRDSLFAYDLIVLGEVPRAVFQREELEWINQYVASRGGGVIFIDGRRGKLRQYADTPLEPMLPVRWTEPNSNDWRPTHLSLADAGQSMAALAFDGEADQSAQRWRELPPPRWVAPTETLPGAETLVTAARGEETRPAIVQRRFGAGNVLYCGSDETWRWRYELADFYHQRFWNQIAGFVMEPPYAVHSRHVSIDTGGFTFQRDQSAQLRVRLRDQRSRPVTDATVTAILSRGDEVVAETPLKVDDVASGVFRGETDALQPGAYQVRVRATGFSDTQLDVAAEFVVLGEATGELKRLTCNEELLRQMSHATGGKYLREEEVGQLAELLAPMSGGRTEQREWALWRSWLWFLPLVGLFSCEWLLRKRLGLM